MSERLNERKLCSPMMATTSANMCPNDSLLSAACGAEKQTRHKHDRAVSGPHRNHARERIQEKILHGAPGRTIDSGLYCLEPTSLSYSEHANSDLHCIRYIYFRSHQHVWLLLGTMTEETCQKRHLIALLTSHKNEAESNSQGLRLVH